MVQISTDGGDKEEKEYMCSFAPSHPPDKSKTKTVSPSHRVNGVWGGLVVASSVLQNTSVCLSLYSKVWKTLALV